MATNTVYAQTIPSLNPLESGHTEPPVDPIQAGNPMVLSDITAASKQYRNRKNLHSTHPELVTDLEVVAAKQRKHAVQLAHFDGSTPQWARQMHTQMNQIQTQMQTRMSQIQTQMNQMEPRMQTQMNQMETRMQTQLNQMETRMQTQMNQIQRLIQIESQRSRNFARHTNQSAIAALMRASDGTAPADANLWFPGNQHELFDATTARVNPLLGFYGLDLAGNLQQKRDRLANHLGVVL